MTHRMVMRVVPRSHQSTWSRVQRGVDTFAKTLGAVRSAHNIGKALYGMTRAAAPYAAAGAAALLL